MNQTNYNIKSKSSYTHLTLAERKIIQADYYAGRPMQFIADKLGRSKSSIHYELSNNGKLKQDKRKGRKLQYKYYANTAHNKARDTARRNKLSETNKMFIKQANSLFKKHPSYSIEQVYYLIESKCLPTLRTFYNWLYLGLLECSQYKKSRKSKKSKFNDSDDRVNIREREIDFGFKQNDYTKLGHYEVDTVVDGLKKGGLITFNHRATMRLYVRYIPNKKATTVNQAIRSIINQIGAHNILSITSDNGTEFAYSKVIEKSYNLKWYYCDPYRSGQRGQNERLNRDLRTFFPKGTNFKYKSDKQIEVATHEINNMPRRKFNGASSIQYSQSLTSNKTLAL